jgi:ferredoxin-NADP reductase/DMSO/TMAO reductase YedYZ heme-binding membrane subunit
VTAWALLSVTVGWGLLASTRILGERTNPGRPADLHRFLAVLSLAFLGVHLVALVADSYVDIGLPQLLVPFTSAYRPVAVAWGVLALYLVVAVQLTSWLRPRVPYRWWRYVHTTTFALFVVSTLHAVTASTDAGPVRWIAIVMGTAFVFLTTYRLLNRRSSPAPSEPPAPNGIAVVVHDLRPAANDVVAVTLAAADRTPLPAWEPGAHVDLVLPSGAIRQYSLCGDPGDTYTVRLGVLRVPAGRGGSAEVHELSVGQRVWISLPRNKFPLVLADHYTFVAGGIGITAILPMVRTVARAGLDWRLVYGGRSRASMAFADELLALGEDRVRLVPQDTDGLPDLVAVLEQTPAGAAVYCCGPEPLSAAMERTIAADFPDRHLHVERFSERTDQFQVELRRSGHVLTVPAERTLLAVIRDAVPTAASSCEEGFCGTCRLRVLAGVPDHRDTVLPATQRDRRDVIYPCVSRSRGPRLVVDL